ncbi:MAG: YiiX/YebB-like N1pC/P60 family cysteine hydrolase [Deltaproteobacteria bacterium]|nr:YiiX/YebB-like N1pC/P60 family cysteine hydrolase [Deltaproteobacteria bacterium]
MTRILPSWRAFLAFLFLLGMGSCATLGLGSSAIRGGGDTGAVPPGHAAAARAGWSPRTGDLVFRQSRSRQAQAIELVTHSPWGHTGIVLLIDGEPIVLEAVEPVKLTPLEPWLAAARGGRWAVRRHEQAETIFTPDLERELIRAGRALLGTHYDGRFEWSDRRLYCSELVWKLYARQAKVRLGEPQRYADLDLSHPIVGRLIRERLGAEERPKGKIVTPGGLFDAPGLRTVAASWKRDR